jgi:DNA-binding NtrC family response regulator
VALVLVYANSPSREAWQRGLEQRGHTVLAADDSPSALARLAEGGIDMVFIDDEVAGGPEPLVAGITRLPDPMPFVLISGDVGGPAKSAHLGAVSFLPKPCRTDDLDHLLRHVTPEPVPGIVEDLPTEPIELELPGASRRSS